MRRSPLLLTAIALLPLGCSKPPAPPAAKPPAVEPMPRKRDIQPEDAQRLQQAFEAFDSKDVRGTMALLGPLIAASAKSSDLSERLAHLTKRMGAIDLAWQFAIQALRIDPESPAALVGLAAIERELDWSAPVRRRLEKAKKLAPRSVEPRLALAEFLESEGQNTTAETELRELIAMAPDNPTGWGLLATNLHRQGRYDDARKALDDVDRRSPGLPSAVALRAQVDLDDASKRPQEAATLRERAKSALADAVKGDALPITWFLHGRALEETGDQRGARDAYEEAYKRDPDLNGLRTRLGRLRIRLGDTDGGEELIAEERTRTEEREELSRAISRSAADQENAEKHREVARLCEKRGNKARARLEWGLVLRTKKNDVEAMQRMKALVAAPPQNNRPSR